MKRIIKAVSKTQRNPDIILTRNMMLKNIVELGKFSYELEEKREISIVNQSGQMLMALSIFSAALYMVLPVIIDYTTIAVNKLAICVGLITITLLVSFILVLFSQWRYKYRTIADIDELYKAIEKDYQNYLSEDGFYLQWKEQLTQIHSSRRKINDVRVNLIKSAMILFVIAIMLVPICTFILIICS